MHSISRSVITVYAWVILVNLTLCNGTPLKLYGQSCTALVQPIVLGPHYYYYYYYYYYFEFKGVIQGSSAKKITNNTFYRFFIKVENFSL